MGLGARPRSLPLVILSPRQVEEHPRQRFELRSRKPAEGVIVAFFAFVLLGYHESGFGREFVPIVDHAYDIPRPFRQ